MHVSEQYCITFTDLITVCRRQKIPPGDLSKAIFRASGKTIILSLVISFWFAVGKKKDITSKNKVHEFAVMLLIPDDKLKPLLRRDTVKTTQSKGPYQR